jgi:hypothetical protein
MNDLKGRLENTEKKTVILGVLGLTLLTGAAVTASTIITGNTQPDGHELNATTLSPVQVTPTEAEFRANLTDLDSIYDAALIKWNYTNTDTGETFKGPANIAFQEGETVKSLQPNLNASQQYSIETYTEPVIWEDDRLVDNFKLEILNEERGWNRIILNDGESPPISKVYLAVIEGAGGGGHQRYYGIAEEGGNSEFGGAIAYGGEPGLDGNDGSPGGTSINSENVSPLNLSIGGGAKGGPGYGEGGNGGKVEAIIKNFGQNRLTATVGSGGSGAGEDKSEYDGSDGDVTVWVPP